MQQQSGCLAPHPSFKITTNSCQKATESSVRTTISNL